MDNYKLLDKLDNLLDEVDATLLNMDLPKEVKRRLTEYSYKVFEQAEAAVCELEVDTV